MKRIKTSAITILISVFIFLVLFITYLFTGISNASINTSTNTSSETQSSLKIPALIRLEDVSPGGIYKNEENLDKLYAIADYLHQEGIPFQVSVIPRDVEPKNNYDVSITDNTEYARKFVTTMKSLEKMGGIIGIHGYTHQSGNSNSVEGFEFYGAFKNPGVPKTYEYAKDRIDKAFDLFIKAGIYPAYWETPHYTASAEQHRAFEDEIGLCYENSLYNLTVINFKVIKNNDQSDSKFDMVPTPLGYLGVNENVKSMMRKVEISKKLGAIASFYYHPFKEFNYLHKATNDKGEIYYVYDQKSPLHQLVRAIKDRGYTFESIYAVVGFVPAQSLGNIPFSQGDKVFVGQFKSGFTGKCLLLWNKASNQWHMVRYTAPWYAPRGLNAFEDLGIWLKNVPLDKCTEPVVGYFKNKSKEDLLLLNTNLGSLILAENNGDKFIPKNQKWQALSGLKNVLPLAGELNGDGLTDLILYDQDTGRIGTALNKGGHFNDIKWQSFELLKIKKPKLLTGDFNGDGTSDIIVVDIDTGEWIILTGGKVDGFAISSESLNKKNIMGKDFQLFIADINGDGKDDLIIYNESGLWERYISDGSKLLYCGSFGPWGLGTGVTPLVADINGDKRADLVVIDNRTNNGYNLDTAISVFGR